MAELFRVELFPVSYFLLWGGPCEPANKRGGCNCHELVPCYLLEGGAPVL